MNAPQTSPGTRSLLIISFSDLSRDARLLKQIRLFSGMYRVSTCGYGPAPEGVERHYRLDDSWIHWKYNRADLILRRYSHAYWHNEAVKGALVMLRRSEFDAILANDFDTVPLALRLSPRVGVHADLHEYAPLEKEDLRRWKLFVAPFRSWICQTFLPRCASVTTVCEGIADRYGHEYGVRPGVVWNATPYAELSPTSTHVPIRLVHSGVCLRGRHLELTLAAVEESSANITLDLYLVPNDPVHLAELKERFGKSRRIHFCEPLPYEHLVARLNDYDVGVFLLPPRTFSYLHALPNKFFDFIQARLGVVVGPSPEMARLVTERANGAVADDFTAEALTAVLDTLTPARIDRWKAASDAAAFDMSAEQQMTGWVEAIQEMLG